MSEPRTLKRLGVYTPVEGINLYLYNDGEEVFLLIPEKLKDHPRVLVCPEGVTPDVIIDRAKFTNQKPPWPEQLRKEFPECRACGSEKLFHEHYGSHSEIRCAECSWRFVGKNREAENA